ncbi:MAG: transcriptional regulator [bacterium]
MKGRRKEPPVPVERQDTIRHEIIAVLTERPLSAKGVSAAVRISEKEVYDHLDHIQRSLNIGEQELVIAPARCRKCGFLFRKRERFKKPGRCPVCKGEAIEEPLFSIRQSER